MISFLLVHLKMAPHEKSVANHTNEVSTRFTVDELILPSYYVMLLAKRDTNLKMSAAGHPEAALKGNIYQLKQHGPT